MCTPACANVCTLTAYNAHACTRACAHMCTRGYMCARVGTRTCAHAYKQPCTPTNTPVNIRARFFSGMHTCAGRARLRDCGVHACATSATPVHACFWGVHACFTRVHTCPPISLQVCTGTRARYLQPFTPASEMQTSRAHVWKSVRTCVHTPETGVHASQDRALACTLLTQACTNVFIGVHGCLWAYDASVHACVRPPVHTCTHVRTRGHTLACTPVRRLTPECTRVRQSSFWCARRCVGTLCRRAQVYTDTQDGCAYVYNTRLRKICKGMYL